MYNYGELPTEEAKAKAMEWWLREDMFAWHSDYRKSLDELCAFLNIRVVDCEVDADGFCVGRIKFLDSAFEADELKGIRLWKFLNATSTNMLYVKEFSRESSKRLIDKSKRFTTRQMLRDTLPHKWFEKTCPFTGFIADEDGLQPIRDYLKNPTVKQDWWPVDDWKDISFMVIVKCCVHSLFMAWSADIKESMEEENVAKTLEANEYEFMEDGSFYGR